MIGSVVKCRQTGDTLWVVRHVGADGRLHLRGKQMGGRFGNRLMITARVAGAGDVIVISEPPIFEVGEQVLHDGMEHTITAVRDDHIVVEVPARSRSVGYGDFVLIAAGNTLEIPIPDLVLEEIS